MEKSRLTLNQETLKRLTEDVQHNNGQRYISQVCNTQFLSCPECNPPRFK
jgi:hypothetical protein